MATKQGRTGAGRARLPARYFALLCELLRERGVDVAALLRAAKIWPTQIHGPDASLTVRQFESLVFESQQRTGRADLAFELGRQIKLSSHEILGYGILTSPTLDYALQLAARYYRLITPAFRLEYRRGRPHCELHFQPALRMEPAALQFLLEVIAVSFHDQFKALAQTRIPPYDMHVSYAEPAHAQRYRELKPVRVLFSSERLPGARIVLDAEIVAQKLPMADRGALKMAEERCEDLLRKTAAAGRMTEWVTMMLRESHQGLPSLAELARLLNQSPRTLDRHLGREGSRFLELSKGVRTDKACALLRSGTLSATQIAYQLGYKELANFTRAFKQATGMTPSQYRAQGIGVG